MGLLRSTRLFIESNSLLAGAQKNTVNGPVGLDPIFCTIAGIFGCVILVIIRPDVQIRPAKTTLVAYAALAKVSTSFLSVVFTDTQQSSIDLSGNRMMSKSIVLGKKKIPT